MISGEKTILRAIEPSDIGQLWEWSQDEETMRLRNFLEPPRSRAEFEKEYSESLGKQEDDLKLAIVTRDSQLIGEIALHSIDTRIGDAELTIWIGQKQYWGRGFGSDAVRTMVRYGFEHLNLHRVTLYVHESNGRAIRAYEKCGFVEEGRFREAEYMDGKYMDVVIMGVLRGDFDEVERKRRESRINTIPVRT